MARAKTPAPVYDEAASFSALTKVAKVLSKPARPGQLESFSVGNLKPQDMCKLYAQIKPSLELALPLIARVPVYGNMIVLAIGLLMKLADVACPINPTS